jgi:hypothetical protein
MTCRDHVVNHGALSRNQTRTSLSKAFGTGQSSIRGKPPSNTGPLIFKAFNTRKVGADEVDSLNLQPSEAGATQTSSLNVNPSTQVGPTQLMLCAIMCVTFYGLNYWICIYILGAWDHVGGSCVIHIFGAFFGMGCTLLASQKGSAENPDNAPRYNADVLCIVGVILNWMTFPSFNAYFAPAAAQEAVVVNT